MAVDHWLRTAAAFTWVSKIFLHLLSLQVNAYVSIIVVVIIIEIFLNVCNLTVTVPSEDAAQLHHQKEKTDVVGSCGQNEHE